jgi:hypothetical protein
MALRNYIQTMNDVSNENLPHQLDHHDHHDHQWVKYPHGIWHRENEVDDMQKGEENKRMYNKANARLDAWIIQTMDQDYDFDDEDYEHDDREMHRYHLELIHW